MSQDLNDRTSRNADLTQELKLVRETLRQQEISASQQMDQNKTTLQNKITQLEAQRDNLEAALKNKESENVELSQAKALLSGDLEKIQKEREDLSLELWKSGY